MKGKKKLKNYIAFIVIALIIALATIYTVKYGRTTFKGMPLQKSLGSKKKDMIKPDMWYEDFFGFGKRKGSSPKDIRRKRK